MMIIVGVLRRPPSVTPASVGTAADANDAPISTDLVDDGRPGRSENHNYYRTPGLAHPSSNRKVKHAR